MAVSVHVEPTFIATPCKCKARGRHKREPWTRRSLIMLRHLLGSWGRNPLIVQPILKPYADGLFERTAASWTADPQQDDPFANFAMAVMQQEIVEERLAPIVAADAEPGEFAPSWLNLLLDNHRLPPQLQLDADGLQPARALLAGYFLKQGNFEQAVAGLLTFVEERFNGGHFAQAAGLLQIFESDLPTRRNNERHLFFEELQAAFATSPNASAPTADAWKRLVKTAPNTPWERLFWMIDHLRNHATIRLHCLDKPRIQSTHWVTCTQNLSPLHRNELFDRVHPPQWRMPEAAFLRPNIAAHLNYFSVEQYVTRLTRVAYYLLLATGNTGYDGLILDFYRWLGEHFNTTPSRFLSQIHRETTVDDMFLSDSLQGCLESLLSAPRETLVIPSERHIDDAVIAVCQQLATIDPRVVAPGEYDLGGLFLDQILGFRNAPVEHRLRMHRFL